MDCGRHLPERRRRPRRELCDDLHRLLPGELEEPGEDVLPVLRGEDPRELHDDGEAEATVPDRLEDLGDPLDELGGRLAVLGGALREAELPVEEDEEARVPELEPRAAPIEVRVGEKEVGEGGVLVAEESGEPDGQLLCVRHARTLAREFEPSGNARSASVASDRCPGGANGAGALPVRPAAAERSGRGASVRSRV
jgi:hypothetical protein